MRMVCIGYNYGINPDAFFPSEAGKNYTATRYLKPFMDMRDRFTVFSNLDHPGVKGGHAAVHAFLSGVLANQAKDRPGRNVSVDQMAADHVGSDTRFASLQLDIGGAKSIKSWTRMSWTRNGVPAPPITDLRQVFDGLFQETSESQKKRLARSNKLNSSILDVVMDDAALLKKRLNPKDLDKLDEYFTSIREVEKRLNMSEDWLNTAKPVVDFRLPDPMPIHFVEKVPLYYELIKLALQTDSTRVVSYAISEWDGSSGIDGVDQGYHTLTHHGRDETRLSQLRKVEDFLAKAQADFIRSLDAVKVEEGRSLLDQTMVLSGSGMGNASSHSNVKLPLMLAGGGFRHGEHKVYSAKEHSKTPACNLYLTMLQRFGLEVDQFGTSTGTLDNFS
ncbi:hypothetical protein Mal15_65340 [Stieleria maiorica]|uniref:DUF1552 domain-containing protein n=2 Tax=Stieleria maiorica TaxID=2795974 RepID=A0A5B9MM83_9BACT|nr:hypothetical protein Mal15_65340 [Stieleria maiorica]